MRIQHNIMSLNAHRQLGNNNNVVSKSLEKLSSGFKINRAGDDAAGLAISEKMRAQITGLTRAQSNAQDGISLVQTAEGALNEVHSMLNRLVDLSTQSANGTFKSDDRQKIQDEVTTLTEEIDRISQATNFNGINLLDGSLGTGTTGVKAANAVAGALVNQAGAVDFTISGLEAGKTVTINLGIAASANDGIAFDGSGNATITIKGSAGRVVDQAAMDTIIRNATLPESAKGLKVELSNSSTITVAATATTAMVNAAAVGAAKQASATVAGVTFTAKNAGARNAAHTVAITNTGANAIGAVKNADGTTGINLEATKDYSATDINQMLTNAGADITVSFDGKKTGAALITVATALTGGAGIASGGGLELQIGDTADSFNKVKVMVADMSSSGLGLKGINVTEQGLSSESIAKIKSASTTVSTARSALGALQNRLEHTINNLGVTAENMTAAESRIRDVDMASEMMMFTKNNVLTQAAQAMLAQANQQPQSVLQLLR